MAKSEKPERAVILSKRAWKDFLDGQSKTLTIYSKSDLHHESGDDPTADIVWVKITEI